MAATSRLPIVGIGASAGGLEALNGLFGPMPDEVRTIRKWRPFSRSE